MFCRAHILAKKVSARAFKVVPGKTGEAAGEIGIEGTTIEAPTEASNMCLLQRKHAGRVLPFWSGCLCRHSCYAQAQNGKITSAHLWQLCVISVQAPRKTRTTQHSFMQGCGDLVETL